MWRLILAFSLFFGFPVGDAFSQEGFVLQDKPSAQCSIYLCDSINGPTYLEDGSIVRPIGWETWVFIGSPLTPDELNGGNATFKEFHSVYIEPSAFEHYRKTGEFPNGTQMVKVRSLLYEGELCWDVDPTNGSCVAVSGRGYFNGDYSGFELTVKDTTRYNDPGGWVYLNFGEERPWMPAASPFPAASCNACHEANGGDDFVFTQFYPVLRDNDPKLKQSAVMPKMEKTALEPKTQMPAVESPLPTDLDALYKYL
ncbi:MAG: cytochrome P460 family protein, partial [Salaquimonas sp.]